MLQHSDRSMLQHQTAHSFIEKKNQIRVKLNGVLT